MKVEDRHLSGTSLRKNAPSIAETSDSGLRLHSRSPRKVKLQNENVFEIDHPIPA